MEFRRFEVKKIILLLALLFPIAAHAQTAAYSGFCDQGATPATVSGLNSTNRLQGVIPYCTVTVYLDGVSRVSSATYTSGGTITGSIGQTCNASFTGGTPSGSGSIALTGANVIAGGTAFSITPPGVGQYSTAPTTATLTNGTASCSGTATVVTTLAPIKATIFKDSANTPQTNPYQTLANGQILFYAATGQGYDIVKSGGIPPLTYITPLTVTDWIVPTGGGSGVVTQLIPGVGTTVTPGIGVGVVAVNVTPGATLDLEQYSTPVPNQGKLNANSDIATDPGLTPVLWKNDSLGDWLGEYQSPTGGFGPTLVPPRTDLASVTIPFSQGAALVGPYCGGEIPGTFCYINLPPFEQCFSICTFDGGGVEIVRQGSQIGLNTNTVSWSVPVLPAGFVPSSALYIYAALIASKNPVWASPNQSNLTVTCGDGAGHTATPINGAYTIPLNTYSALMSGSASTFNWSAATCTASNPDSIPYTNFQKFDIPEIVLIPYFAGPPAPAAPSVINLNPPLIYNQGIQTISLTLPYNYAPDTGTVNFMAASPLNVPITPGMDFWVTPANSNTTTNPEIIVSGAGPFTITKCGGQPLVAGDIFAGFTTGADAHFEFPEESPGNVELQNPVNGCGSGGGGSVTSVFTRTGAVAAQTGDYTVSQVTGAAPTASPTFTTQLTLPKVAGYTAPAPGEIGYDTTNGNVHADFSSTDLILAGFPSASLPTSGHCAEFNEIGAWWEITDAGAPCGSGGGSGLSGMTAGQIPVAATASTVTSSKPLAGSGAGITTGPTTTTTSDCANFSGTTGQIADSGSPCGGGGGGNTLVGPIVDALVGSTQNLGNGAGKTIHMLCDSRCIVSYSCQVSAADHDSISSAVVSGGNLLTVTLSASNTQTVGNYLNLQGATGSYAPLNSQQLVVLSSGITATQYEATVSGVPNGSVTGTLTDSCTYSLAQQLGRQPSTTAATIVNIAQGGLSAATVAASPATYIPTVTGANQVFVVQLGSQDCLSPGCVPATVEGNLQTIWSYARNTAGYTKIVASTLVPTTSSIYNYDSQRNENLINAWLIAQAQSSTNASVGYFDTLANLGAVMPFANDPNLFMVPGLGLCTSGPCEADHPQDGGNSLMASVVANAVTALTGVVPPIPNASGNSVLSIGDAEGDTFTFTVEENGSSISQSCFYAYLMSPGSWSGSYDSPYTNGPLGCFRSLSSNQAFLQLNNLVGLASGPVTSGQLGTLDMTMQRSQSLANTWCMSASASDALADICSGSLSVKNLYVSGNVTAPNFSQPNVAFQSNYNNRFAASGAGSNNFQPSNPAGVAVQEQGNTGTLLPTLVEAVSNSGGNTNITSVPAGGTIIVACTSNAPSVAAPADSTSDSFVQFGPTSTIGGYSFLTFQAANVAGGSTVTVFPAGGFGCGTGANIGWTIMVYKNVPTSGIIDGTATMTLYPQSSGGPETISTGAVTTTQTNDTLVNVTIIRGAGAQAPNSPMISEYSNANFGSVGDMPLGAIGSYTGSWTYQYPGYGYIASFAMKGLAASQTGDLHQSLSSAGSVLSGVNAQGMFYFKPIATASLLSCVSGIAGTNAAVNDALAPVIGSNVASGGSDYAAVTCNGANWTVTGK